MCLERVLGSAPRGDPSVKFAGTQPCFLEVAQYGDLILSGCVYSRVKINVELLKLLGQLILVGGFCGTCHLGDDLGHVSIEFILDFFSIIYLWQGLYDPAKDCHISVNEYFVNALQN